MRTVKEVEKLTGVSVRTLQYYDEIGVFKPTQVTEAGYRLYDDAAMETLQQILFFKELDFPLKAIKEIMGNPDFDKLKAFKKQKELIKVKRDRLDGLLNLLEKLEKGESCISFAEFDLSEYLHVLEQFKNENAETVMKYWGSIEKFEQFMENVEEHESEIAEHAIKYYGSVERYASKMKANLDHFSETMEKMEKFKPKVDEFVEQNKLLTKQLTGDLTKDVESEEIQNIVKEIVALGAETGLTRMDDVYWKFAIDGYLNNPTLMEANDKIYGTGASEFMGKAFQYYCKVNGVFD